MEKVSKIEPNQYMKEVNKMNLISVREAEALILDQVRDFGQERVSINYATGRILGEPLIADRDFPPFDRVTMDGIAIKYSLYISDIKQFRIQSTQAAGNIQQELNNESECIEVMTGAILPKNTDTIIKYEDLEISNGIATIKSDVKYKQNIHFKGEDRKIGDILVQKNTFLRAPEIAIAASIGQGVILVKKLPKVAIITSGDELVDIDKIPEIHQIRSSNIYAITSLLVKYGITAEPIHILDDLDSTNVSIQNALNNFDILIMSGGVSMGKKDFIPLALESNGVQKVFHKIAQTPGKPFWFGKKEGKLVFALPGNPVSTFLCLVRYFMPWLETSLSGKAKPADYAILSDDFTLSTKNTYFLQVSISNVQGSIMARPIKGHGSGDFANLVDANAFIELPAFDRNEFKKEDVFRIWGF